MIRGAVFNSYTAHLHHVLAPQFLRVSRHCGAEGFQPRAVGGRAQVQQQRQRRAQQGGIIVGKLDLQCQGLKTSYNSCSNKMLRCILIINQFTHLILRMLLLRTRTISRKTRPANFHGRYKNQLINPIICQQLHTLSIVNEVKSVPA